MISDIPHEAGKVIRAYLTEEFSADVPANLRAQKDAVLASMDALCPRLDTPPTE